MKTKILLSLTFILVSLSISAQKTSTPIPRSNIPDTWLYVSVYINNHKPLLARKLIDSPNEVKFFSMADRPESLTKYGKINVMEVYLKPGVKIKKWEEIFEEFHIKKTDRGLPVMLDSGYVYNYPLNTILVVGNNIKSITTLIDSSSKVTYLNINTGKKRYKHQSITNEVIPGLRQKP
jgi:hypothetical protein